MNSKIQILSPIVLMVQKHFWPPSVLELACSGLSESIVTFSGVGVAWHWSWREYLYHGNQQRLQTETSSPFSPSKMGQFLNINQYTITCKCTIQNTHTCTYTQNLYGRGKKIQWLIFSWPLRFSDKLWIKYILWKKRWRLDKRWMSHRKFINWY